MDFFTSYEISSQVFVPLGIAATVIIYSRFTKRKHIGPLPPVVVLSNEDQFQRTREAYENALRDHGPVIGVPRKGRLEYITDGTYAKEVLTDDKLFSFEEGTFRILNIHFLLPLGGGALFRELEDLVTEGIVHRLERVISQIYPLANKRVDEYIDQTCDKSSLNGLAENFPEYCHKTIVESAMSMTFGKDLDDKVVETVASLEENLSAMMGIYQNIGFFSRTFPLIWKICSGLRVVFTCVLPAFFFVLGPKIWASMDAFEKADVTMKTPEDEDTLLWFLANKAIDPITNRISFLRRVWVSTLVTAFIFASVHNTTTVTIWVLYELARRPEYLEQIRTELIQIMEHDGGSNHRLTADSLRQAVHLDSFIREVLRLKGDTLAQARLSTCDAPLGEYIIPKGHIVIPMSTLVNEDPKVYGDSASKFEGFRWVNDAKPAVMVGPNYVPFGLGRFACGGRVFAVSEIKMLILLFIAKATPSLRGGKLEVVDPMNVASTAPVAELELQKLDKPLL